jgi:Xaa-Pro aminopeptidase
MLTAEETAWLDRYHARVKETLSPLVDAATRAWLAAATRPLGQD